MVFVLLLDSLKEVREERSKCLTPHYTSNINCSEINGIVYRQESLTSGLADCNHDGEEIFPTLDFYVGTEFSTGALKSFIGRLNNKVIPSAIRAQ